MANDRSNSQNYTRPLRRLLLVVVSLVLIATFLVWRIDSPRVERFRAQVTDRIVPNFDWAMAPVTGAVNLFHDYQSYNRIAEQNQELHRELRKMQSWKEAALQLEQENARLLDLNSVRLDPRLTFITGVVLADSGSPFRQSVLLNVGARDGLVDGWATMDGIGLVGRISGVAKTPAVLFYLLMRPVAFLLPFNPPASVRLLLVTTVPHRLSISSKVPILCAPVTVLSAQATAQYFLPVWLSVRSQLTPVAVCVSALPLTMNG